MNKIEVANWDAVIKEDVNIIDVNTNQNILLINKTSRKVVININKNITCNLTIINKCDINIEYIYNLYYVSKLKVNKLNEFNIQETTTINLNEEHASIYYVNKSISFNKENYITSIYHHAKNTTCNIYNHAVNINEYINYEVSSYVKKGIKGCITNQYNRIVNFNKNKCTIKPNLYIDEYDIEASHSALIDLFDSSSIFYLMSRGITYNDSILLLTKGFLLSNIDSKLLKEEIIKTIDRKVKYE
ncbi:MAG: SufD family Fe-S cluster assembly protein [Bacilli bacterium]|nr:SufD family Fe-S cluster assembly protein [Bacilli bacterium]